MVATVQASTNNSINLHINAAPTTTGFTAKITKDDLNWSSAVTVNWIAIGTPA